MGEIKTERLLLRACRKSDAARIAEIADNRNIAINMGDVFPYPCTLETAERWAEEMSSSEQCDKNFMIVFEGEIVGVVSFKLRKGFREGTASIRYWLGEDYWGKGVATEAFAAVVDYIFENYDVRRLDIGTFSWNSASHRILEKCGFVKEGCLKNSLIRFGKVCNECRHGLLKCEWEVLNHKIDD